MHPVSYTHLDVYKRQVSTSIVENCHFTDIGGTALLVGTFPDEGFETHVPYTPFHEQELCTGTVSYTHLDVYKRQGLILMAFISEASNTLPSTQFICEDSSASSKVRSRAAL